MNIANIETFLAIVHCRTLSQAAESLFLSQSTISQRLKTLERELGVSLFDRKKGFRNVELSHQGIDFVPLAEKWLELWGETKDFKTNLPEISLAIGSTDSLSIHVLMPLYKQLIKIDTPIHLHIRTQRSEEMYSLLDSKIIDIGFSHRAIPYKNILVSPVFKEKIFMICRTGKFPKGPVHPNQLNPRDELFLSWSPEIQRWHDYWWNPAMKPRARVDTATLIMEFMDQPHFWAMCPLSVVESFRKSIDVEIHEFIEPPPPRISYMLLHKSPKPSSAKNIKLFRKYFEGFIKYLDWAFQAGMD